MRKLQGRGLARKIAALHGGIWAPLYGLYPLPHMMTTCVVA